MTSGLKHLFKSIASSNWVPLSVVDAEQNLSLPDGTIRRARIASADNTINVELLGASQGWRPRCLAAFHPAPALLQKDPRGGTEEPKLRLADRPLGSEWLDETYALSGGTASLDAASLAADSASPTLWKSPIAAHPAGLKFWLQDNPAFGLLVQYEATLEELPCPLAFRFRWQGSAGNWQVRSGAFPLPKAGSGALRAEAALHIHRDELVANNWALSIKPLEVSDAQFFDAEQFRELAGIDLEIMPLTAIEPRSGTYQAHLSTSRQRSRWADPTAVRMICFEPTG